MADEKDAEHAESEAFRFGDGYVGGRGYGGTNYDLSHGYRVGSTRRVPAGETTDAEARAQSAQMQAQAAEAAVDHPPATRGGYEWGEEYRAHVQGEPGSDPAHMGHGPYHERLKRQRRTDSEILKDVEDMLFYDTWVDADAIRVSVEDGIVKLEGKLPSFEEVRYATDDAWEVEGVRGVRTELEVDETAESGEKLA